jgi:hypothetical protein
LQHTSPSTWHSLSVAVQSPSWQVEQPGQTCPQLPQLLLSVWVLTQPSPSQQANPGAVEQHSLPSPSVQHDWPAVQEVTQ